MPPSDRFNKICLLRVLYGLSQSLPNSKELLFRNHFCMCSEFYKHNMNDHVDEMQREY